MGAFLEKLTFFIFGLITLPFGILFFPLTLFGIIEGGYILLLYSIAGLEVFASRK